LARLDRDGIVEVTERDRVDRVHLVLTVEVRVEGVHHHDHLVGFGTTLLGVDDERAVQAAMDVLTQRQRVTVIQVRAERLGDELVGEALPRQSFTGTGDAIHPG
jgi:hypothetical protein